MLRGSGGAIFHYSIIYVLIARKHTSYHLGLLIIASANIIAIILDICSVLLNEYQLSYTMIDLSVEL